ncbi:MULTISPECIES: dienelactone hydrolase family protein [unclassified Pseudomonas]|uniref:dienelactone hydrolase family protein n=1 Tax=unclassified Pseudomonas TaxID=196821 RepID=UPI000C87CB14|nr:MULTISPECIES: dienelactone hydrolase family protein [unclassified Pseudomonas]PMU11331.1 carboxymethylenebutenolidase [Pseudomonas sp. FW305-20]PMU14648.1 carboxymethylenebutenolidase [Pseudomonas sp. FW305-122]PMU36581.1 carboxymethylenebutenolidase [Pseudomonas sp. FW305-47B]PMX57908.1 carboxymethylenebutenolidase [Pseudomonas sp. FW305-33]PMX61822.1 carboxymethylenebutenolidase [Pseudomonas sp. FW305-60]
MSVTTQWIEIDSADGKFGAYLAIPHTRKGPGIVLIQEIFGVNEHIRSVAEQYAADGYLVIAPDLFWRNGHRIELGYDEAGWKRAVDLMNATDVDKAQTDIELAIDALKAQPGLDGGIASIGYCFGGLLSYHTAANGLVDVAIAYYGGGIQNQLDRADEIEVPLLMHFGEQDSHIPLEAVEKIAERFENNDNVEIVVYPEAEHGFNCSHRDSYNQRAAAEAHGNTLIFLGQEL